MQEQPPFNLFISWSGKVSREIATALHEWLPTVVQVVNPFMSEKDIEAGQRGLDEIADNLKAIKVGVFCVTPDNQESRWLNFEAGALSRQLDESRVIPLLFGVERSQVKHPLGQFQAVELNKNGIHKLTKDVNSVFQFLDDGRLNRSFNRSWPELDTELQRIRTSQTTIESIPPPARTNEEMIEEVVQAIRDQSRTIDSLFEEVKRPRGYKLVDSQLTIMNSAIRRVLRSYSPEKPIQTLEEFGEMALVFDAEDWGIIKSSPFLTWYLQTYYGAVGPYAPSTTSADIDEVPF